MVVAVIGAGPAGASLAWCLARRGIGVVVHEKARFPRPKACGEGLLPPGVAALRQMGLEPPEFPRVSGLRFVAPSGESVEADFPGGHGLVVHRERFDAWLVAKAREAGAEVREGSPAPAELEADVVVAADGLHSRFAEGEPDSPRRIGFSTHARGIDTGGRVEIRFRPEGEAYLAPCGDGTLVAALMRLESFRRLEDGDAVRALVGPVETTTPVLATSPLGRFVPEVVRGNLLLFGDAAGAADPITGEGMSLALRSAPVAAEAIASGDLASYARWRLEEGDALRAFGRRLLSLARWADRVVPRLRRRPEALAELVEVAVGRRRLADVRWRTWLKALA
jgi:flavin-dependent dehydrogenase